MAIQGLKLIYQTGNRSNVADDPSYPFKLEMKCRPPEFMIVTFVSLYGGCEEVIIRGMTEAAILKFVELNEYRTHPRLISMMITGPNGIIEEIKR